MSNISDELREVGDEEDDSEPLPSGAAASSAQDDANALLQELLDAPPLANEPDDLLINAAGTTTPRALADRFADVKDLKRYFGAAGNGSADDTSKILDAAAYMTANPGSSVYLPAGDYVFSGGFVPGARGRLFGAGMDASRILWTGASKCFNKTSDTALIEDFELSDFGIIGDWLTNQNDDGNHVAVLYNINNLRLHRVGVQYARLFAFAARLCDRVHVDGCRIQYCARDGINLARCNHVIISNNTIDHIDDDAIACHSENGDAEPLRKSAVIVGNRISDAQGIKVLGAQRTVITGNQIERCRSNGIMVYYSSVEGNNSQHAVVISDNVVTDMIDRNGIDGLSSSAPYILVAAKPSAAGSLNAPPGEADTAGGTIVPLYEHFGENGVTLGTPYAGGYGLVISNNVCMRTLPVTTHYSDYGYGQMFLRDGWADPAMTTAELLDTHTGIYVGGFKSASIANNVLRGLATGIFFSGTSRMDNIVCSGNIITEIKSTGYSFSGLSGDHNITIEGGVVDADQLHVAATRNANGTWDDSATPCAFRINAVNGVSFKNVDVKNVSRVVELSTGIYQAQGVRVFCDPTAIGYNASNKGIGNLPVSGQDFLYVIQDSDPAAATYKQILNYCQQQASAVPTTGKFVKGHFIRNTAPAAVSGQTLLGWTRLTTGSAHVLEVDWAPLYASNATVDFSGYVVGRYYLPSGAATNASVGVAPGTGSIRLFPGYIRKRITIDTLSVRVNTLFAGGNVQAAIYAAHPTKFLPTGNALVSTASMPTAAAANITAAASLTLEPGLYWFATNCDNATAIMTAVSAAHTGFASLIGSTSSGLIGGAGSMVVGYSFAQTFGTWPDLTGAGIASVTSSSVPLVIFKVASIP